MAGSFGENLGLGCPVTINGIAEGSIVCHCRSNGTGSCGAALVHGFSATAEATDDNCGGCGSCEDMCAGFNPASSTCSACPAGRVDNDHDPTVRRSPYSATSCGHDSTNVGCVGVLLCLDGVSGLWSRSIRPDGQCEFLSGLYPGLGGY